MRGGRNLLLRLVGLAALALAAACTTIPEVQVPKEVKVPVAVPCLGPGARPQRPATTSQDELAGMDTYRRTLVVLRDLLRLQAWSAEAEAALDGCSRIPLRPPP